jgi:hypothetical protein
MIGLSTFVRRFSMLEQIKVDLRFCLETAAFRLSVYSCLCCGVRAFVPPLLSVPPWILRSRRSLQLATWTVGLASSLRVRQDGFTNVKDAILGTTIWSAAATFVRLATACRNSAVSGTIAPAGLATRCTASTCWRFSREARVSRHNLRLECL